MCDYWPMASTALRTPRICIVSPALAAANNGNWQTASRWQRFLAPACEVDVTTEWNDASPEADLLIALHARRSAASIERFRDRWPARPIVLILTGTDLYRDLQSNEQARRSMQIATAIVVLQEYGTEQVDVAWRDRTRVIVQSAPSLVRNRSANDPDFLVVGHLRPEKDPQTLWSALRSLATDAARSTTVHIGGALEATLGDAARSAMSACPDYRWLGELPHPATRERIARARALVHPSLVEGGANVVIEAMRSKVPVLASRIDGNVGLLGPDYGGYFAAGDATSLAMLMRRFRDEPAFVEQLSGQCARREPLFRTSAERRAVRALVADLIDGSA